jgi:hypothetical protein
MVHSSPRASLGQRFSVLITIVEALSSNLKLNLALKIFLIGKSVIFISYSPSSFHDLKLCEHFSATAVG